MKASTLRILLTTVLLVLFGGTLAATEYRVILRDGSWVRAQSKPVVVDGQARIRLLAGQLTLIPESHVNWEASESWNRRRPGAAVVPGGTLPAPAKPVPATIHIVRDPNAPAITAAEPAAPAEAATEVQPPPAEQIPAPKQQDAQLRRRIRQYDEQITGLRDRKADLEARARSAILLDDAAKLRAQAQEVQRQIQTARAAQNQLILQLSGRKP